MERARLTLDDAVRFALVLAGCVGLRFIPHPPNVEPVMTSGLPFAKRFGPLVGAAFAGFAILLFDAAVGQVGPWSAITAGTYVIVGAAAGVWFARLARVTRWHYAGFAFVSTIFYDGVTGYAFGSMLGYPLPVIIAGQVPFTLLHLASNVSGAFVLSPLIERFIVENPSLTVAHVGDSLRRPVSAR